ncbi:hypothetical protein D0962_15460 [Leptolyngbyaceae cyanobacterium CCMR0082]|uniref:Peptidase M50 n=1 Tax=Adonisia turfae CCMR0082 TaxID=2304604 RepID=A0A6M0S737_9CYAN|nr:hypothetical protein [Adonisia turfae]NEZ64170.1 hypothetical protein [Adonisia turfae CCMR0082]
MQEALNKNFEVVYIDYENDALVLRNQINQAILRLSKIEYEMIKQYAKTPDYQIIFNIYKDKFDFDVEFVEELIGHARRLKLLLSLEEQRKLAVDIARMQKKTIFDYAFLKLAAILKKKFGLNLKREMRGNFQFFKLFSVDLKGTWLEKVCSNKIFQKFSILTYFLLVLGNILLLAARENYNIEFIHLASLITLPQVLISLIVLFLIALTTFLHESAHYLIYKWLGGYSNSMGLALLQGMIPVVYTSVDSVSFWKDKGKKIKVSIAGIAMDILLLLLLANMVFVRQVFGPDMSFICFLLLCFMALRVLINGNFFVPGSDGYFVFVDALGVEEFCQNSMVEVKRGFRFLVSCRPDKFLASFSMNLGKYLYASISIFFITVYWLMIFAIIFFPTIYHFFWT